MGDRLQADPCPDGDADGESHHQRSGLQGGLAEYELEVLRQAEDHPEHREEREGDRPGSGREPRVAEQCEVEHRRRGVGLAPGKRQAEDGGRPEEGEDAGVGPARGRGLDDRVHERAHGADRQHGAGQIEAGSRWVADLRDEEEPQEQEGEKLRRSPEG